MTVFGAGTESNPTVSGNAGEGTSEQFGVLEETRQMEQAMNAAQTSATRDLAEEERIARQRNEEARQSAIRNLNQAAEDLRRQAREAGGNTRLNDDLARRLERAAVSLGQEHEAQQRGVTAIASAEVQPAWMAIAAVIVGIVLVLWLRGRD